MERNEKPEHSVQKHVMGSPAEGKERWPTVPGILSVKEITTE